MEVQVEAAMEARPAVLLRFTGRVGGRGSRRVGDQYIAQCATTATGKTTTTNDRCDWDSNEAATVVGGDGQWSQDRVEDGDWHKSQK